MSEKSTLNEQRSGCAVDEGFDKTLDILKTLNTGIGRFKIVL
jgi:hypothetical protein